MMHTRPGRVFFPLLVAGNLLLVSIRDVRNSPRGRRWIEGVYGEYMDSLTDLNTGYFTVIGTESARQDETFAGWFSNDLAHPLVILRESETVGFALVRRGRVAAGDTDAPRYRMSEFFIRQPHRRAGIGRDAATLIFDRFAGDWEIVEYLRHPGSVAFWRRVLANYASGNFVERIHNGEVLQRFKSRPSAS